MSQAANISVEKVKQSRISQTDFSNLEFGAVYSDHMLVSDYSDHAWNNTRIIPFQPIMMSPASSVLHYGQTIFEGMKAYRAKNGDILIFRMDAHIARLNKSCERLCIPPLDENIFMDGIHQLVQLEQDWIPNEKGCSLYLRPFVFATDEFIGVKPSSSYKFITFACPVAGYYKGTVKVIIETEYVRAAEGGIGYAKAGGNYAASLLPAKKATDKGYQQILWTDSKEHKYFEESGTMNVMFVIGDTLVTPPLSSSILAGITRDSILTIAREWGVKVEERRVSVEEVVEAHKKGLLKDAFGTGTAATITHIAAINYEGEDMVLPPAESRELSNKLNDHILGLKYGDIEDTHGWIYRIKK
ncbi:MAG: branched-chain amino acid aminotransferase [Cytophagaceae bacterium]|nr:branched-chain amino acid aminotransferase [Cytophagaceae bacterium]